MRLSTEQKLLTVRVGLFSLREKAPTNKGSRKETFDWFRSYSVRSYSPSPGKALSLSLYPVLLSPDTVSTMEIVPENDSDHNPRLMGHN